VEKISKFSTMWIARYYLAFEVTKIIFLGHEKSKEYLSFE